MKHFLKTAVAFVVCAAMLGGCSAIPDKKQPISDETVESSEAPQTQESVDVPGEEKQELPPKDYDIESAIVQLKLNAEGGVFDGNVRTDGEYDGDGYMILESGKTLVHIADVPASQHYRIIIAAYSYSGAAISLSAAEGNLGTYYIPASEDPVFSLYAIDHIYLPEAPTLLNFTMTDGYASLDYIIVESSKAVASETYVTDGEVAGTGTGIHTLGTMKYLSDMYGARIITAQNVTPGTNAEIDAVYNETGRYPAMRCGDLMYSSLYAGEDHGDKAVKEVELALEWGRSGGIVSMGWHWYAPQEDTDFYKLGTTFDLDKAVTESSISQLSIGEIEGMCEGELLSEECVSLVKDIDAIAEQLKRFSSEYLTVVWQPLPDGDTELYWWGGDPDSYKWLWRLMFDRLNDYHEINNLIWVWNGSNADYYPGDNYCDIIGQGMFTSSNTSNAGRFAALAGISPEGAKPVAMTSCDRWPLPDYMYRDNAMWLWAAPASGDYSIHGDGSYSETYTNWQTLNNIYNSLICATKDELPDFSTYALEDEFISGSTETVEQ